MLTRRRIVLGLLAVLVAVGAYTAWQAYRVQGDLRDAEAAAQQLRASIDTDDETARSSALDDLQSSAAAAHDASDGPWWGLLTHLPLVGDDVTGIRALSSSLDIVASDGIAPLADSVDGLATISTGGQVDLAKVAGLQEPMTRSAAAFREADAEVADLDSSGYVGALKSRFGDYRDDVATYDRGIRSAAKAVEVLPTVLGADGPRDYLLVFQNNAEIRATGGLPGSWSVLHAEDGRLTITQQGTGAGFGRLDKPVVPLTKEEDAVYSDLLGVFFLDANFTPDFPRTAELWRARWQQDNPDGQLDGVLSLDPVALSYLLRGTGPVQVGADVTLTSDNAVEQLLSAPYARLPVDQQDAFFASVATSIFNAVNGDLPSPLEFVKGMARAATEGRFLMASYDDEVARSLATSTVRGAFSDDDGTTPHVEISLNDATGSKMSYYLRYRAQVTSRSCQAGAQSLLGTMSLSQTITSAEADKLPDYVNGGGMFGTPKGFQTVVVRLYGPTGSTFGPIRIDGAMIDFEAQQLAGRPVATLIVQVTGPDDVLLNWSMTTAEGQTGDGSVGVTPSVTAGSKNSSFASSCT